jgi:hypothetical protein
MHLAEIATGGHVRQTLRDILVVNAGAWRGRQQALLLPQVVGRPIAISPLSQALLRRKEVGLDMHRARGVLCHQAEAGQILPPRQIQAAEHWRILER